MEHESQVERQVRAQLEELVQVRSLQVDELRKRLVREERMAALGKITATVSHELRNPLATIRGSLFLIGEALHDAPPRARKALARAERNLERTNGIIDELLDYARVRPLQRERTDVDGWLRQALVDLSVPSGVELHLALGSGAIAELDRPRLFRCIINLVTNSADSILGGSPPVTQTGSRVELATRLRAGRLEIEVSDDGPGVPPELQEQVFEPFFSTKAKGVGLGLPLVRQIAQQHGGGVTLASRPGATTFKLWLPAQDGGAAGAPAGGDA
jgi:signal transduction histidine kinase